MTSPLPIVVDSEDRGMKRPVEEVARLLQPDDFRDHPGHNEGQCPYCDDSRREARENARKVLAGLVQLGFLNDNYFVAKKAEEAEAMGKGAGE